MLKADPNKNIKKRRHILQTFMIFINYETTFKIELSSGKLQQ